MKSYVASLLTSVVLLAAGPPGAAAQQQPRTGPPADSAVVVDGSVALAALMSLADGHLQQMADFLETVASGPARSGNWARIRGPLADVGRHNVPAVLWFARPDGSYWTVDQGRTSENLANRPYFPRLMAGEPVLGSLVVSRSSGRNVAIVAVPVRRPDGRIIGALGASIHLDSLSLQLAREMDLPRHIHFFSVDSTPRGALNRNVTLIFTDPLTLGEDLARAVREMLASDSGTVSYEFRGVARTLRYRRSAVTGWWYALGIVWDDTLKAEPGGAP